MLLRLILLLGDVLHEFVELFDLNLRLNDLLALKQLCFLTLAQLLDYLPQLRQFSLRTLLLLHLQTKLLKLLVFFCKLLLVDLVTLSYWSRLILSARRALIFLKMHKLVILAAIAI